MPTAEPVHQQTVVMTENTTSLVDKNSISTKSNLSTEKARSLIPELRMENVKVNKKHLKIF